jgi:hypothetical protein
VESFPLLGDHSQREERGVQVGDGERLAAGVVEVLRADLPFPASAEDVALAEFCDQREQSRADEVVELPDRGPALLRRERAVVEALRVLDEQESTHRLRGEMPQRDLNVQDTVGKLRRIAADEIRVGPPGSAAEGVEQVGDEGHVQHLLQHDAADRVVGGLVGTGLDRVHRGQIRRDGEVLDLQRALEIGPQLGEGLGKRERQSYRVLTAKPRGACVGRYRASASHCHPPPADSRCHRAAHRSGRSNHSRGPLFDARVLRVIRAARVGGSLRGRENGRRQRRREIRPHQTWPGCSNQHRRLRPGPRGRLQRPGREARCLSTGGMTVESPPDQPLGIGLRRDDKLHVGHLATQQLMRLRGQSRPRARVPQIGQRTRNQSGPRPTPRTGAPPRESQPSTDHTPR